MDGLAGSLALVAARLLRAVAAFVEPNLRPRPRALARRRLRLPPLQRAARPAGAGVHGGLGQPGARLRARALGLASYKEAGTTVATLMLPILILAIPILDTALVTVMRLARAVRHAGGPDHTSHRLVYRGLSEKRAVAFLVAVSAGLGLTSLAYAVLDSGRITTVGVLITSSCCSSSPPSSRSCESDPRWAGSARRCCGHCSSPGEVHPRS